MGRRGGDDWAVVLVFSRLDDRVTRGNRVGTESGGLAEPGLFLALPLLELFRGTRGDDTEPFLQGFSKPSGSYVQCHLYTHVQAYIVLCSFLFHFLLLCIYLIVFRVPGVGVSCRGLEGSEADSTLLLLPVADDGDNATGRYLKHTEIVTHVYRLQVLRLTVWSVF